MIENIRLALKGIWSHKMRSFLTMLGIIIGIASIIAIVSTIKGTNEQIKQNLIGSGQNTVNISLTESGDYEIEGHQTPSGTFVLPQELLDEVKVISGVEDASFYLSRRYADGVYYQNKAIEGSTLRGIDLNYLKTMGYVMKRGRFFVEADYKNYLKSVILDQNTADGLLEGEEPIGKVIEIQGQPFTVIGVVELSNHFKPVIHSIEDYYMYYQDRSANLFVPDTTWPMIYQYDEPKQVVVKVTETDLMGSVGREVADLLNGYLGSDRIQYKAMDLLEQAKQLQELSAATNQQLIWIASISLLVGGIGVMNIMLVSVTERTSEIGLKKAIGARKRVILIQFLTESVVLTSLGGFMGVLVGIGLAEVISRLSATPVAISVPAIVASVLFSMLIGIVFGLLPSIKASNLNPIDALRYE